MHTRARTIAAALVVAALAWILWPRTPAARAHAPATTLDHQTPSEDVPAALGAPAPPAPPGPPAAPNAGSGKDAPPVIDSVTIEKDEVCEGEENLVTVKAHSPSGEDADLRYTVGLLKGPAAPLQMRRDMHWPEVTVFGRSESTSVAVPLFRVRSCPPQAHVQVVAHLRPNRASEFDVQAHVVAPDGIPFRPVRYRWSFGDGTDATTAEPLVTHSFEMRAQDRRDSYFLLSVEAEDAHGQRVRGRTSLGLENPAYEALRDKGIVQLVYSLEPRFPELSPDGVVHQTVRLWQTRPDHTVTITKVERVRHKRDGTDERTDADPRMLGSEVVPGAPGIEGSVSLDLHDDHDTFSVDYSISGTSDDGLPARAQLSVMRPPERPTRESSTPVRDPLLAAKIRAARSILGQQFVTDEDIHRLEWEGKLASLDVQPIPDGLPANPALPARAQASPQPPSGPSPGDDPRQSSAVPRRR